jgi:ADP-ribosylation factor GTPase-activating protein 1
MDSWSDLQIKKMEAGGNRNLNSFLAQYGIPKETDIVSKYNSNAASIYRDRIQALAEGRSWRDPPVVKENSHSNSNANANTRPGKGKPPLASSNGSGWDDNWDNDDNYGSRADIRRNQSTGDVMGFVGGGGGVTPSRSKSTEDIYTRTQLEASAANKEGFFARKMAENESRPEGLPPSQGGKYVGFGSSPGPAQRISPQNDYLSVVSEVILSKKIVFYFGFYGKCILFVEICF